VRVAGAGAATHTCEDMEPPPRYALPAFRSDGADEIRRAQRGRCNSGSCASHDEHGTRNESWVPSRYSACPCDRQAESGFASPRVPRCSAVIGRSHRSAVIRRDVRTVSLRDVRGRRIGGLLLEPVLQIPSPLRAVLCMHEQDSESDRVGRLGRARRPLGGRALPPPPDGELPRGGVR
jgi:hypothetical protein